MSGRMLRALAFLQGFNGRRNPHLDFSLGLKRSVSNLVYAVAISFTSGARTVLGRGFFYNRCFNCDRSFYKFFFCFFPIAVRHSVLVAFVGCTGLFFRALPSFRLSPSCFLIERVSSPGRLLVLYWGILGLVSFFGCCQTLSPGRLLGLYWAIFGHSLLTCR